MEDIQWAAREVQKISMCNIGVYKIAELKLKGHSVADYPKTIGKFDAIKYVHNHL